MIDPETGWFEIIQYNDKQAATIENLVYKTWLCRYALPTIVTCDIRNECRGHAFRNNLIKK